MGSPSDALRGQRAALGAIALGGAIGSAARYAVALLLPHDPNRAFPWSTVAVNIIGCLLIGVLMAVLTAGLPGQTSARPAWLAGRPLARPFLGIGVLGGFTTFSTYAVDANALFRRGAVAPGAGYLVLTLVGSLAAVAVGLAGTRAVIRRGHVDPGVAS